MRNLILREIALPVSNFKPIFKLVKDMINTLEDIGASVLAAPQVMSNTRVIVYRLLKPRISLNSG